MMQMDLLEDTDTSIPDQISNTLRAWSFKMDTAKALASHPKFVNDFLLPVIMHGSHLEVYHDCWIILDNLLPLLPPPLNWVVCMGWWRGSLSTFPPSWCHASQRSLYVTSPRL